MEEAGSKNEPVSSVYLLVVELIRPEVTGQNSGYLPDGQLVPDQGEGLAQGGGPVEEDVADGLPDLLDAEQVQGEFAHGDT